MKESALDISAGHEALEQPNRKRKRKHVNPLSQARGKQQSASHIWFRRTGAGFHLFVQYYAGQPWGTVCEAAADVAAGETENSISSSSSKTPRTTTSTSTSFSQHQGAGLSRAAKRRKKKKKQPPPQSENNDKNKSDEASTISHQQKKKDSSLSPPSCHPTLELALQKLSTGRATALRSFCETISQPLPVTFRIRQQLSPETMQELRQNIKSQFSHVVQPVPWGEGLIFQANCSKSELKQHPELKEFLMETSQSGQLARQEVGSMLPVLALQQANSFSDSNNKKLRVLDLCASPGSKTLQALELLLLKNDNSNKKHKSKILANDVSQARVEALQEALQRSGLTTEDRVFFSCQDARYLRSQKPWDVIICDVPCSGDGTVRKEFHILESWKPSAGNALHELQLDILSNALTLLKPGGTVCYSTCSLNPVENEAVVAAAVQRYNQQNNDTNVHKVELVDFSTPEGFHRRPGLSTWNVADFEDDFDANMSNNDKANEKKSVKIEEMNDVKKETDKNTSDPNDDDDDDEIPHLTWYSSYKDAKQANMPHVAPTLWPQSSYNELNLEKCTRLWPTDHNSGGFFLALIRKT